MSNDPSKSGPADKSKQSGLPASTYGRQEPPNWRKYARFTLWGLLALMAVLFVFGNSQEVQVNFIVREATLPLYVALLVAMGLGLVIGGGGVWFLTRRHAKKKAKLAKVGKK